MDEKVRTLGSGKGLVRWRRGRNTVPWVASRGWSTDLSFGAHRWKSTVSGRVGVILEQGPY